MKYPICPICHANTVVLFTPPKEPIDYSPLGKPEYVDWDKAHLYCSNGLTDCRWEAKLFDLKTPRSESYYEVGT